METAVSRGRRGHERPRLRTSSGYPAPCGGSPIRDRARRGQPGLGNSVAVLPRVPERRHQPQDMETDSHPHGRGMAATPRLGGFAFEPPDWRNGWFPAAARRSGPAAPGPRTRRPRCPDRRDLRCPRGGRALHLRSRFLTLPRTAYSQSASGFGRSALRTPPARDANSGSVPAGQGTPASVFGCEATMVREEPWVFRRRRAGSRVRRSGPRLRPPACRCSRFLALGPAG